MLGIKQKNRPAYCTLARTHSKTGQGRPICSMYCTPYTASHCIALRAHRLDHILVTCSLSYERRIPPYLVNHIHAGVYKQTTPLLEVKGQRQLDVWHECFEMHW